MKHKISELCGAQLDVAVAKAEGLLGEDVRLWGGRPFIEGGGGMAGSNVTAWQPSTDWTQGGPLIDRERIAILPWTEANAVVWMPGGNDVDWTKSGPVIWWARADEVVRGYIEECPEAQGHYIRDGYGPTPLIAAMRAYVLSKFGEEVELP